MGNLTEQATSGASEIAFSYSYNKNGYITGEKRTENGTETENSYAYNALGELTSFLQSTGYGESYAYDKAGNMLEKAITGTDGQNVTLKMAYNAANQLTGMTNGQSKLAYSYDKNGSLIQKTLTSKTYGKLTDRYASVSYTHLDVYKRQVRRRLRCRTPRRPTSRLRSAYLRQTGATRRLGRSRGQA